MNPGNAPSVRPERLAEQIADLLLNGGTLGAVYDYDDQDYEVVYALGHSLYAQARYTDAVKVFGYLVMLNHLERRFTNAFASSLQMVKRYEEAIKYYTMTSVMDMRDPVPTFHTCECMIALGMVQEAREGLGVVIGQCRDAAHGPLKERAQALLALLDQQTSQH